MLIFILNNMQYMLYIIKVKTQVLKGKPIVSIPASTNVLQYRLVVRYCSNETFVVYRLGKDELHRPPVVALTEKYQFISFFQTHQQTVLCRASEQDSARSESAPSIPVSCHVTWVVFSTSVTSLATTLLNSCWASSSFRVPPIVLTSPQLLGCRE